MKFSSAYGAWIQQQARGRKIVLGRDGRVSGPLVRDLVIPTLVAMGFQVVDLGLSTTPTVEIAVPLEKAAGGIIITASHNPRNWNALKLLNHEGEFLSAAEGKAILELAQDPSLTYNSIDQLGSCREDISYLKKHIDLILAHPLIDAQAIRKQNYSIVVDPVNSGGALYVPALLQALGLTRISLLNAEPNGEFGHDPEPLPENLGQLASEVRKIGADLGIAVDPDVDRLSLVCEDGSFFGEEYTLVAVADYVLGHHTGNTVSNLSSTRALAEITHDHGGSYFPSAVGEVNVVARMKECGAVIGGEGNGGVIFPDIHYGRDALVGIALFLSHLAGSGQGMKALRSRYPDYSLSKNKFMLEKPVPVQDLLRKIAEKYPQNPQNTEDGLRIEFGADWVHIRTSNTEPILRIYAEGKDQSSADRLAQGILQDIRHFLGPPG